MKKGLFLLVLLILFFVSCKKHTLRKITLDRDCTGTYLWIGGKGYKVCNPDKLSGFGDGSRIRVKFQKKETCLGSQSENPACSMVHEYHGWVEVLKVK